MSTLALRAFAWLTKHRHGNLSYGVDCRLEPSLLARGGRIALGDNVTIRLGTVLMPAGGEIRVGSNTSINHYCVFHGGNGLEIGDSCLIAPRVAIYAANHAFSNRDQPIRGQGMTSKGGVRIDDDVWIGTGSIVLDGVRIGRGAVVGAGSVVTKSVEPFSIVTGNPARKTGER